MPTALRTTIFVVLLLALPLASYYFMFKPREAEIKLAEEDIQARRDKLAALERANADIKDLPQEIEKLRAAIAFFEGKLPEQKEMAKVLDSIWQTAGQSGLTTKSVRPMKVIRGDNYSELPIRIVLVGPFGDPKAAEHGGFYPFLKSLEEMKRITRISEMTIEKDSKVEGQMTADMVLTIYFENPKDGQAVAGLQ